MAKSKNLLSLFEKYRELLLYAVFGVLTTAVNIGVYWLCHDVFGIANVPSNVAAWVVSVLFAFVTNKIWVFESKSFAAVTLFPELGKFVVARLATGALDTGIMWLAVDVAGMPSLLWKIIANVIVIVLNYIFSKLLIFKKQG